MLKQLLLAGGVLAAALSLAGAAAAQSDPCSSTEGYPEGSPAAVLAGIRGLSSGEYAACVERRRSTQPSMNWSATQIRSVARTAVLAELREPSSAVFRLVRRTQQANGTTTFCGEVSARNGHGGMSGFTRFQAAVTAQGDTFVQFDSPDLAAKRHFEIGWQRYCVAAVSASF